MPHSCSDTNGVESFWSMPQAVPNAFDRYVQEFAGKHNIRDMDTAAQMTAVAARLVGKKLRYRDLIANNGLPSGARP